ncbi:MAG: DinB family protein [Chloroflexota bacterium]
MVSEKAAGIKEKLSDTREELIDLAGELTDDQWNLAVFGEDSDWQVIDIVRHVADSERGMTNLMKQIKEGRDGVPPDFDIDRWNRRAVSKLQHKSPQELLEWMNENRMELISFIDTLDEDDWDKKGRHASLRIMSIEEICHLIADHEHMHLLGVRQAFVK